MYLTRREIDQLENYFNFILMYKTHNGNNIAIIIYFV